MDRILVPIDFSAASANSLNYAHRFSIDSGVAVSLLYCYASQIYNRRFDFGKKDYATGIKEMLRDFYEKHLNEKAENIRLIARPGSITEGVDAISGDFKMIILSSGNFSSKIERWATSRTSAIILKAKCPVLIVPAQKTYSAWNKVWHIQRHENEFQPMVKYLPVYKLAQESIAVKTFKQTTFQSALWKSMFFYLKSHDETYNSNVLEASAVEKIDLAMLVSTEKDSFERYKTIEILQLLMRSNIPALIFRSSF